MNNYEESNKYIINKNIIDRLSGREFVVNNVDLHLRLLLCENITSEEISLYIESLVNAGVTDLIRLAQPGYNIDPFVARGIKVHELHFNGDIPPSEVKKEWLSLVKKNITQNVKMCEAHFESLEKEKEKVNEAEAVRNQYSTVDNNYSNNKMSKVIDGHNSNSRLHNHSSNIKEDDKSHISLSDQLKNLKVVSSQSSTTKALKQSMVNKMHVDCETPEGAHMNSFALAIHGVSMTLRMPLLLSLALIECGMEYTEVVTYVRNLMGNKVLNYGQIEHLYAFSQEKKKLNHRKMCSIM